MRAPRRVPALLGAAALAAGLALLPAEARAVQFVGCSEDALVDAIEAANTAGGDTLFLSPFCTYSLTRAHSADGASGLPEITAPITLSGTVSDIVRAPGSPEFRIAKVDGTGTNHGELHLVTVTIRGGDAPGLEAGGGIANVAGRVTLTSSTLRDNRASVGGGLYNDTGTSTLNGSVVVGNTADDPAGGGGIYELSGSVNLVGTLIGSNAPNNCAPASSVPFCSG
ncbi:hypothetical protein [Streptomyces sp. NPDC051776]|uniref:hypothetical protein n=1 Tax=Streptomyces sp. NPDC051776 TaxID=3155414 RepID=UPI0034313030